MKKAIKSFPYIIPLLILGAVLINSDIIGTNSDNLNIEETEMSATPNIEFAKIGLVSEEENPILPGVESASTLSSNLVFIPSSHDFGTYDEKDIIYYGLQLKNVGGGQESGQVFVFGDQPFSCYSGCSFNLAHTQSQYVTIKFAPCELPYLEEVHFDANVYANSAQAYVEGTGYDQSVGHECDY